MSFGGLIQTISGRNELAKAELGELFQFTEVVLGDGKFQGSFSNKTSLEHEVMRLSISSIKRKESEVILECDFNSKLAERAFYLREIGIIGNGKLCYYDNAGADAEYVDPESSAIVKQKRLRFVLAISSEVELNVELAEGLYALDKDLKQVEAKIPAAVRVKGAAEQEFRTGDIILTAANVGAAEQGLVGANQTLGVTNIGYSWIDEDGNKCSMMGAKSLTQALQDATDKIVIGVESVRNMIPAAVRVKGNAESAYRTGDVNLTAANIGLGNVDNTADANKNVATANQVNGVYTGNGGQQPPSYVTSGKTRFNMMNAFKGFTNPAGGYMDVILMDNYAGGDVPYVTGIGVTKNNGNPRMFIANGEKGSTGNWAHQVEVITSSNVSSQNVAYSTKATQDSSGNNIVNTYAKKSIYGDTTVSLGRKSGTTVGAQSAVVGGSSNTASGESSIASGGAFNVASGRNSTVSGGTFNVASGYNSTVLGGTENTASSTYSVAIGGENNTASGMDSAVIGGWGLSAENDWSTAFGRHNAHMATGTAFVIGNGAGMSQPSNAFSVMFSGVVKAKSTITGSTTADYAEFFEWLDGNPRDEDRVGRFVTLTGNKITIANSNSDYILGIVSGEPFVLGNGDCDTWNGMYMKDDFNRTIYEPAPKIELNEETGERVPVVDEGGNPVYEGTRPKLNPEYDPDQPYISRFDRKEWSPVGMLGVLSVIDDGSCQVDGFCCCSTDGIATACEKETEGACRVIERISENVVRVVLK